MALSFQFSVVSKSVQLMLVSVDVSSASLSGVYETFLSTEEDERDEKRTGGA